MCLEFAERRYNSLENICALSYNFSEMFLDQRPFCAELNISGHLYPSNCLPGRWAMSIAQLAKLQQSSGVAVDTEWEMRRARPYMA